MGTCHKGAGAPEHLGRQHWIFDLDGTLTVAVHDFDAIRQALGLPASEPILEALERLPPGEATRLMAELDAHEMTLARRATQQAGAWHLLETLQRRGARLGIVTRNNHAVAIETLRVCGLRAFFGDDEVVGRGAVRPKPHPDGVQYLLRRWGIGGERAVVVGDYLFDLQAGRAAGTGTIYVDPTGRFPWAAHADTAVRDLAELHAVMQDFEGRGPVRTV